MQLREARAVWLTLAAVLLAILVIAGCGGGGDQSASAEGPSLAKNAGHPNIPDSAPEIEVPTGLPPQKLTVKDLQKGTGEEAQVGDEVGLEYYGIDWKTGLEHSNTWSYSARPFYVLGKDPRLLYGLSRAIPGMREGGSREVIIPRNFIYYPDERHTPLGRLAALIYKVYLVEVNKK